MAGKIQLAAKVLLGTTVLASGAGGVYYGTTHGWSLPGQNKAVKQPSADLDAVASAWTDRASTPAGDIAPSSPVARSADASVARADEPVVKPSTDDRYGASDKAPKSAVVAKDTASNESPDDATKTKDVAKNDAANKENETEPQPEKAKEPEAVVLVSHTKAGSGENKKEPTPAAAGNETPLTRGQEPKDDTPPATQVKNPSADIGGALNNVAKSTSQAKEPQPLNAPSPPTNIADASQRAKQAFGNTPPAAAGERYGDRSLPAPETAALPKPAALNPFGAQPMSAPATSSKSDTIQPLQTTPNDIGGPLREIQPSKDGMRPQDMNRTAPAVNRDFTSKDRFQQTAPVGNSPNTDFGPMPSSRGAALSGAGGPADGVGQPLGGDGAGKPGEKALEGPQQPTLVIQKFAPGEVQVGKPAKFVLQVRNSGAQAADNVTIQDEIPQGTQLISTSPNATNDGGRLIWQLGKLSAGEDRTVEMQIMPKAEGDIGSVATVSYSAQASVKTHCTMPQLAIRMTAPSEVMIGSQQHVKIEIRNPGSGDATGVMLFENVPPNVKHAAGPALEFEIGTLHAGETRELDLVLTAEKAGKVTNTLNARAQGNLQIQQHVDFEVIAPALTVALQGPERRYLERPATYEVCVENPGTAAAHDVQIVTRLPKGMRFVKANNMGEYDAATHAVYWSLAELPKGEKGTVELVAIPTETGPQTLQVESRAQQGLTDKTQREVLVEGLAAIKFEVRALEDPIEVGGETGYEIRVLNQGTKAAANVQITAQLPAGLKLVSAEGETQHKMDQGRLVFEPLQQLAPKADTVYRIRAQGIQAGDQRIVVEVKTDDLAQPIRREESTRVFGDQ
jgi:uncharacterized repeat protein (TIGR01451 family)